jgi:hypothetical protein
MPSFRLTPWTDISIDASYNYFLWIYILATGASAIRTLVYSLVPSMYLTTYAGVQIEKQGLTRTSVFCEAELTSTKNPVTWLRLLPERWQSVVQVSRFIHNVTHFVRFILFTWPAFAAMRHIHTPERSTAQR